MEGLKGLLKSSQIPGKLGLTDNGEEEMEGNTTQMGPEQRGLSIHRMDNMSTWDKSCFLNME